MRPRRVSPGQCLQSVVCLSPRPQIAVRLLAHKIQSPQEWEAVQALTVGFSCVLLLWTAGLQGPGQAWDTLGQLFYICVCPRAGHQGFGDGCVV